ncbi:MAG: nitroreductase family protein [Bacillota bacterium]
MDIYELIKSRSSVRAYKTDPVPREAILRIIEAARMAPSWANRQSWRFVVVDSQVGKNIIGKASGQDHIAKACMDAPYVVVLCAYVRESGVKNGLEYFMFDCGLAMANLVLTAEAEGLSTCIVGWFNEGTIRGILNVPKEAVIVAFTPLGYADEEKKPRKRKKQDEIMFHNNWGKIM